MRTGVSSHVRRHVVGYIALFVALSGTAAALPGKNAVDSGDIKNNKVKSVDVKDENLGASDLGANSVGSSEVAANAVGASEVGANALGGDDIDEQNLQEVPLANTAQDLQGYAPIAFATLVTGQVNLGSGNGTFYGAASGLSVGAATESVVQSSTAFAGFFARQGRFVLLSTPDGDDQWVVTLRESATDTAITCTLSQATPACNSPGPESIDFTDLLSLEIVASGTPAATRIAFGWQASAD